MIRGSVFAVVVGSLALSSCKSSSESLVSIDVKGDQSFSGVTLTLTANGLVDKSYAGVTFDETMAFEAGMYLPSSFSGAVAITATTEKGGCITGQGAAVVPGVAAGKTTPVATLTVTATAVCLPIPDAGAGTGGDNRGTGGGGGSATGTGGLTAGGSGGSPGTGGGPSQGTGGAIGTGGMIVIGGGSGGSGTGGMNTGTGGAGGCGNLIDDMEADTGYICQGNGRVGHWFTYVDPEIGSQISPPVSSTTPALPQIISPARGSSNYAMHASGSYYSYAGIACLLDNAVFGVNPTTFNATGLLGVSFYAKGSGGLSVVINNSTTIAITFGGTCDDTEETCFGASATVLGLSASSWNYYTVPFSSLEPGTTSFNVADIWSVGFQPTSGTTFDLWIDDLSFY
jgi:hypothetical protein